MKIISKVLETVSKIKEGVNGLIASCKKVKKIISPFYERISKEKITLPLVKIQVSKKLAVALTFITIHVAEWLVVQSFSSHAAQDTNLKENPLETTTSAKQIMTVMGNIVLTASIFSMKRALSFFLRNNLERNLKDNMAQDWLSNKASTGLTYIQEMDKNKEMLPVSEIFSSHIGACSRSVSIGTSILSDMTSILINLYYVGKLFNPQLMFVTSIYGISIGVLSHKLFNQAYSDLSVDVSKQASEINLKITNIQQFGSQTVAYQGEKNELEKLVLAFRAREHLAKTALLIEIKGEFVFGSINQIFSPLIDILFPQYALLSFTNRSMAYFMNQTMNTIMNRMQNIIQKSTQEVPEVMLGIEQVTQYKSLMNQWKNFTSLKLVKQAYKNESRTFSIQNFKVHIFKKDKKDTLDNAKQILEQPNLLWGSKAKKGVSLDFIKGKVYLFPDKSGRGKTTILKAFFGMYPLASGKVTFPCKSNEIRFVSRNTFLPVKGTLLEAITFPTIVNKENEAALKAQIEKYIDEVGFLEPDDHKKALCERAEWANKLSDGEKQRFAIIGILINKPKVLVLDEALGNLDKPSKNILENLLKTALSESVILYADHHPIPGFADYVVQIKDGSLSCKEESQWRSSFKM